MPISAVSETSTVQKTNDAVSKNSLDKDDFLKLLITELRYQDALNPMDDREFMTQLAQLTSLEQMQNLNKTVEKGFATISEYSLYLQEGISSVLECMLRQNNFNQALNLLGREVTYIQEDQEIEGTVNAIKQVGGIYYAVIGEEEVALTQITSVK